MNFQTDPSIIQWHVHFNSSPEEVYAFVSTDSGRARFWAESAKQVKNKIHFSFPNGLIWEGEILEAVPPRRYIIRYLGGSIVTFEIEPAGDQGTDLTLTDKGVDPVYRCEVIAGWVSVLMALKAAVDFSIDLRNHDPRRTWDKGFADN